MDEIIVKQTIGTLDANFDEMKEKLNAQLDEYRNLVFTEETKKQAKETVAELRKGKKELADRCKAVKKEWLVPLDTFMEKADGLAKMFDEPIDYINSQIEAFETRRIESKRNEISNIYADLVVEEELMGLVPLTKIYNPKWENATFSAKEIRAEIMAHKENAKNALVTIKGMHTDMEEKAIDMFAHTLDLPQVIIFINNYENQKKEVLEREREQMRREEEERIRAEERRKIEAEQRAEREKAEALAKAEEEKAVAVEEARAEVVETFIPTDNEEEETAYQYTLMLTPDAKEKVEMFLNSIGVEFFVMEVD